MKLSGKLLPFLALVLAIAVPATLRAADEPPRNLPISKVWKRSTPNERFLAPPLLLRAGAGAAGLPTPFSNKIDVNRCSLQQLQDLPGVGAAWGARLMAGRPYRTVGDLARAGLPFNMIDRISPLIEFGP